MFDHVGLGVSDYELSKTFYKAALAQLGVALLMEPRAKSAGFGNDGPSFWIAERPRGVPGGLHLAFTAEDRAIVDAFHAAGLGAGGVDNGAPGVRAIYHPHYYGAYILDPDGNNIEVVCHRETRRSPRQTLRGPGYAVTV
jgi:catechol 2,3-dioxygenase-like lactoylglutathione lyase family enzyme